MNHASPEPAPGTPPPGLIPGLSAESIVPTNTPAEALSPEQVHHHRMLFWEDVVRQMLTSLAMMRDAHPEMFDGRVSLLTRNNERVQIADVVPLFACGITTDAQTRAWSVAVECTVFRVTTPSGEMFTFPLAEIRGIHTLSPELLRRIEQAALNRTGSASRGPFGLAAFTSAARASSPTPSGGSGPPTPDPQA